MVAHDESFWRDLQNRHLGRPGGAIHRGINNIPAGHLILNIQAIPQLHCFPGSDGLGDVVKGPLHHVHNFLLDLAGFLADPHYEITLCHKF
jgi:hypothetical protein